MPNYLNVTLTPSNQILHTTRLKTLFDDYDKNIGYEYLPLFYEEWSNESSELLLKCDEEVQLLCSALKEVDLSYVKSLKEHYEADDALQLTKKLCSINSLKGLKLPTVLKGGKYTQIFHLVILQQIFHLAYLYYARLRNMRVWMFQT